MSMLVPFVGRHSTMDAKRENAYARFRGGDDTMQIANHYKCSEATALRWITTERSRQPGLADPYRAEPKVDHKSNRILVVQGVRGRT